jgi:hypothetical protein
MSEQARDEYIASVDPRWAEMIVALDGAVMAAEPRLEKRIAYRLLMYTLGGDKSHWVCAIGPTKQALTLRFLWGIMLDDPRHLLRPGTSTLQTLDFPTAESIDPALVTGYVHDAVAKMPAFIARGRRA